MSVTTILLRAGLLALLMTGGGAQAQDWTIRAEDSARLAGLNDSLGGALREAFAGGDATDLALLADALHGTDRGLSPEALRRALAGDWSCRTIKIGGITPMVAYAPFRCRITADGGFEKLTGSQRTRGRLVARDGQLIYLGTSFIAGDTPPAYEALPETTDPSAMPQNFADVALVESPDPGHARLLFPAPWLESRFNLLVLSR